MNQHPMSNVSNIPTPLDLLQRRSVTAGGTGVDIREPSDGMVSGFYSPVWRADLVRQTLANRLHLARGLTSKLGSGRCIPLRRAPAAHRCAAIPHTRTLAPPLKPNTFKTRPNIFSAVHKNRVTP